jgi:hypothetical protein
LNKQPLRIDNGPHIMNSYAFYGRNLINTIQRYLPPNFDRNKIEELFVDGENNKDYLEEF